MNQADPWVGDVYRPKEQRAALLAFTDAIGAKRRLKADEAGNPRIEGKYGSIYVMPSTCDPGKTPQYQIYFHGGDQRWRHAKDQIGRFAKLTNNGEDEGILLLKKLPTPNQGDTIRWRLHINKRFVYAPEVLEAKRDTLARARNARKLSISSENSLKADGSANPEISEGQ